MVKLINYLNFILFCMFIFSQVFELEISNICKCRSATPKFFILLGRVVLMYKGVLVLADGFHKMRIMEKILQKRNAC